MASAPAFQLYTNDFLSDKNTAVMSAEEIGVYCLLLFFCWQQDGLPNDLEELSILARVPLERFTIMWEKRIQRCFNLVLENNTFIHPRLEKEKEKQESWRKKSAKGGKNSAGKRKNSKAKVDEQGGADLVDDCLQPNGNSSVFTLQSSNTSINTSGGQPPPAAEISPDYHDETAEDYILRKQLEYPALDVSRIFADFKLKCGSAKYPNLKNNRRQFDKWLTEESPPIEISVEPQVYRDPRTNEVLI